MVFWDGVWGPVCGHCFWDNSHGSTAFCTKLGYTSGTVERTGALTADGLNMPVCSSGNTWEQCMAKSSCWGTKVFGVSACKAGHQGKISIHCSGSSTQTASCTGKTSYIYLWLRILITIMTIVRKSSQFMKS